MFGGQQRLPQPIARSLAGGQRVGVDDGEAEATGRHGVVRGVAFLVEGDLYRGNARHAAHRIHQRRRRMAIARTMRAEQHDAVAVAPVGIEKIPVAGDVEADQRFDPASAVQIGPLVGEPQMRLDDAPTDRFEIDIPV